MRVIFELVSSFVVFHVAVCIVYAIYMAEIVLEGLFDKNKSGVNLYMSFGRIILLIIDILSIAKNRVL